MRDRIIMLQESAEELGFGTIQQALDAGYHEVQDLVKGEFKLEKVEDLTNRAYREAHETWESERDELLGRLEKKQDKLKRMLCDDTGLYGLITDAINFIKERCHE